MSFSQERLWFLHQVDPASTAYNLSAAYRFHGPLDIEAFSAAFVEVTRRHPALRTSMSPVTTGGPGQAVEPLSGGPTLVDLTHVLAAARLDEVRRLAAKDAATPFDLTTPPLRATLLRLGPEDHV